MHYFNWIIGSTAKLDLIYALWEKENPNAELIKILIPQDEDMNFDFTPLDKLDPTQGVGFVVFDETFGNFRRAELMQAVMERGIKLTKFVSPLASIPKNTKIGINTFVGDFVTIGANCRIDFNTFILPGSHIGNNVQIKSSCWISSGVIISDNVDIGKYTTIRSGSLVLDNVKIGNQCDLGWNKIYNKDISDKTYYDPDYEEPIIVYN